MKKFLSILLATLMLVSLVPSLVLSAAVGTVDESSALTTEKNGRIYHYYESFDTAADVQGAAKVIEALGWSLPDNYEKWSAHKDNVSATERDGVFMYEIKNGRLYLRNRGADDEYIVLANAAELGEVFKGAFTMEYTLTYLATSTNVSDGYFSLLYNVNSSLTNYGEVALRISGWGNNRTSMGALDAGDVSLNLVKENSLTAYRVDNDRNPTLYERVWGDVDYLGSGNRLDLRGSKVLADKEMRVRLSFDGVMGPRVYVNDVLVSDPTSISDGKADAAKANFDSLMLSSGNSIAFCVTPGIDCVVDEITLYEERVSVNNALFITEIAPLPENAKAPYLEIYNGSDEAVNLADYVAGYTVIDEYGEESTVAVSLSDYIGKTMVIADTEMVNLSADAAVLQPGETAILYPVDAGADVAALVATEGATLAGFRAEYGLSADAKVLAIPGGAYAYLNDAGEAVAATGTYKMDPAQYRVWFLGAKGGADWKDMTVAKLQASTAVECFAALVPSVAFGYELDMSDDSYEIVDGEVQYNLGRDGDIQAGYAAHYIYGADVSNGVRAGVLISRCNDTIKALGNTGALLDVQADYFDRMMDARKGRYQNDGALAITEIIPSTEENDAFEVFEITNISDLPLNVYDFGLVSSGDAAYGSLSAWTRATRFTAKPANGITNPNTAGQYILQPGASVVVWNMTAQGYTLDDFRAYHEYGGDVIVAASLDSDVNVVAANVGTVAYGVASGAAIDAFLSGSADRVAAAVSDVLVPMQSICYAVDGLCAYTWESLTAAGNLTIIGAMASQNLQGCEMLGVILEEGDDLTGYFLRETVVEENTGISHTMYVPCEEGSKVPADNTTEYFVPKSVESFFAYGSRQDLEIPADHAIAFSYGVGAYAGKTHGSLMNTMKVQRYVYDMAGRGYGALPYLLDVASRFVTVEAVSGATEANTLGAITDGQGVDITVRYSHYYDVVYLDGNAELAGVITLNGETCGDVYTILGDDYDTWLVNDVFYNAGETAYISGDTVIKPGILGVAAENNAVGGNQPSAGTANVADSAENSALSADPYAADASNGNVVTILAVSAAVLGVALLVAVGAIVYKKRKA